jgi:hypothetical protein
MTRMHYRGELELERPSGRSSWRRKPIIRIEIHEAGLSLGRPAW